MLDLNALLKQLMDEGGVEVIITIRRIETPENGTGKHNVKCPHCARWSGTYTRKSSADRALRSHLNHCPALSADVKWIKDMNGQK